MQNARIELVVLAPENFLALIESEAAFERSFGRAAAPGLRSMLVSPEVSPEWLARLRATTGPNPWTCGLAIVDRESGLVIGSIGFVAPPDDNGMVEIAYGLAPAFHGRGLATEAAAAGLEFALSDPRVRVVRAHTLPERNASCRVLEKNGFEFVGEVVVPEDGKVWRWEQKSAAN